MKLYVIQHGAALPKDVDAERPLTEEGRSNVAALADLLSAQVVSVASIQHSTKLRAKQTAQILADVLGGRMVEVDGLAPDDPVEPWLNSLCQTGEDVALVSHQPFVGRLATRLLTGRDEPVAVAFEPGTALCLTEVSGAWVVQWLLPPALLQRG